MNHINAIDAHSVHRITSGQVVIDLQSAVKELVENSLDAGASSIEVRFQNYGLKTIEVIDNGSGIAPKDHDSIALKHYTSKLATFEDLSRVLTFGFRGEALSSLCVLADGFTVTTATLSEAPMGTIIEMDRNGKARSKCKVARQRGTTVTVSNLFKPLPVRRKEFKRNTKREFQKALSLLHAYAIVPCALENKGVRFTVSNQTEGGRKVIQFKTDGSPSIRASVLAVWGSKALENIVDLDLSFNVETEKSALRRADPEKNDISLVTPVKVQGLISKFVVGAGRTSVDRQFFFVNGRPCNPAKVQKAINEVYRTFNVNQSPFVVANVIVPTHACDINVSPDKRTILLHSEANLVQALKTALEAAFSSARSTYDVTPQTSQAQVVQQRLGIQQEKGQNKLPTQTRERERGEKLQHRLVGRGDENEGGDSGGDRTGGRDEPFVVGVPRLLLEGDRSPSQPEPEPEPEPTLVARPASSVKSGSGGDGGENGEDNTRRNGTSGGVIDRPRTREPSEPLFFPDSDESDGARGRVGDGKKEGAAGSGSGGRAGPCPTQPVRGATIPPTSTSTLTSAPTSAVTDPIVPSRARPSSISASADKPRSVQTVLSTRGAAWNIRRDDRHDRGAEAGRERKRARVSVEAKKSFRSTLSRFLGGGRKALPDEDEESTSEEEGGGRRGGGVVVGECGGESSRAKGRQRAGSGSSQVTMIVPSDDEHAMDVDEPSSAITKSSRAAVPPAAPSASAADMAGQTDDVEIRSEDDWAFSSTLVGTYVPPAGKTTEPPPAPPDARPVVPPAEPDAPVDSTSVMLRVNMITIGTHYLDTYNRLSASPGSPSTAPSPIPTAAPSATFRSAVESANLETAADDTVASAALSRIISKADFEHMAVVGQFNLGFIIVRKRSGAVQGGGTGGGAMDDLFVVDQHAADEKWNFETLQETTVIASQKLFRPQQLQLTAADEMLTIENMDVLKRNGFEVERVVEKEVLRDEGGEREREREGSEDARVRLQLVAQPMSKDTVFDVKDLEELIHLMQDRPRGTMVRCSKARAMFAMRACRRSVMVGKALDKARMTAIVRHMGMMDQPWNCPHGRPTMRHLSDLASFGRYSPPPRDIDWGAYGVYGSDLEEA